jgi:glutamate-ammonia-ligase adenylyltransferase
MGKDGELVPPMEAAAEYYLNSGRAWERQALLKARPVAGDRSLGRAFLQEVAPFVFRRFMDFQALEELKGMRDRILAELKRTERDLFQDVKLGRGGIREIEFTVQSFQLIYGGRYRELDEPNTLACLDRLRKLELLPEDAAGQLQRDYRFLRRVEHWLQLDQNRQARRIPESEADRRRLATALGFGDDVRAFAEELEASGNRVHDHFTALFRTGDGRQETGNRGQARKGTAERAGEVQAESASAYSLSLERVLAGFSGPVREMVLSALDDFGGVEEELFSKLVSRIERFFRQVASRPGLARMLEAGPQWLDQVIRGILRSGMVASLVSHQPALVEGIASAGGVGQGFEQWRQRGESIIAGCHVFDEAMEWIRRLRNERLLMLALAEQEGAISAERASGELSDLADFVIRHTYEWVRLRVGLAEDLPLAIMALGKLGSREFGYLSDLDLMFVYEPSGGEQEMIPEKVVRLAQRLMRMLSTPLQEGPGYSVDAELRPSGSYGPLAVTRKSWEQYYTHEADIWEIQALLRLRTVAGDPELGRGLEEKARSLCAVQRSEEDVWPRLCHLRHRMETERGQDGPEAADIKLGYGGVADLEFLVQGGQLLGCGGEAARGQGSVLRQMEPVLLDLGFSRERTQNLHRILATYRSLEHRLQFDTDRSSPTVTSWRLSSLQQLGLWPPEGEDLFDLRNWTDLTRMRQRVRGCWTPFCERNGTATR